MKMSVAKKYPQAGFTLVELMIALAMSGILVAAVYAAYNLQQKTYYVQEEVGEMQQNIRAAIEIMSGDIRMAAYDPNGDANADIPVATNSTLQVRMDLNDDGDFADTNEDVTFNISDDTGNVGLSDSGGKDGALARNGQAIAEHIQGIDFYYILEDGTRVAAPSATQRDQIQAVEISILAVSGQRDPKYQDNTTYTIRTGTDAKKWGPMVGDERNYRRRFLKSTVYIRNRGL